MPFKVYKIIRIVESGCSTIFFGAGKIPLAKTEAILNHEVQDGWQVVFQVVEAQRFLLFWTRESLIITLGK